MAGYLRSQSFGCCLCFARFSEKNTENLSAGYRNCSQKTGSHWGKIMKNEIHESSGNVFLDLGYSSEDAAILRMRADLMAEVRKWISDQGLTQAEAAEILQVSQSRISDLVRGKWEKFSLEMLIILAMRSGFNLTLSKVA